jgi:prepilin-type processing-associated H-X9-DG protein
VTQLANVQVTDPWPLFPQVVQALAACSTYASQNMNNASAGESYAGCMWAWGMLDSTLFNTIAPPANSAYAWGSCVATNASWGESGVVNATSNHPGGCNTAFVDGSVHFIKSSISMQTYWSLGTRADGEVVSSDSY